MTAVFPNELTDRVIDHLFDDPEALSACALVSSSWIPAVRYHRFDDIRLRWTTIGVFHDILHASPEVGPYVNSMVISHNGPITQNMTALRGIFQGLPNLHKLCLAYFIVGPDEVRDLFSALPNSLEYVEVNQMDIPTVGDLIFLWSQLPRLRVFAVVAQLWIRSVAIAEEYSHTNSDFRLSLTELKAFWWVQHFDVLVDWLCAHNVAAQLRVCSLYITGVGDAAPAARLLHGLGPALESLELLVSPTVEAESDFVVYTCDLARCTGLRELCISSSLEDVEVNWSPLGEKAFFGMPQFFAQLRAPGIKTIVFALEGSPGGDAWESVSKLGGVAAALSRNDALKSVERVVVRLCDQTDKPVGDAVYTSIRGDFKRFEERGSLKIEVMRCKAKKNAYY